jgi:transposase-like protein
MSAAAGSGAGGHTALAYCPYCGDEDLFPHGAAHGAWECRACRRAFSVKFVGLLAPGPSGVTP